MYEADYFAGLEFKIKMMLSDGQAFEDLVVSLFNLVFPEFQAVKAQGALGDGGNDGYIYNGIYYQIYGPENIDESISYAISKIEKDSSKLIAQWKNINEMVYIVNDKFKGANKSTHLNLMKLNEKLSDIQDEKKITAKLQTTKDLFNYFMNLEINQKISLIGPTFTHPIDKYDVDYKYLNQVVEYISKLPSTVSREKFNAPKYDNKIKHNLISQILKSRMDIFYLNTTELDTYFENTGDSIAEEVRQKINTIYLDCKRDDIKGDLIYFCVLKKMSPAESSVGYNNALESLVTYYFESCDIYEEPGDDTL